MHPGSLTRRARAGAVTLIALAALVLAACGTSAEADRDPERPIQRIATSSPLFADIVRQVAGDRAEVFSVIPTGADPHTYEAVPQDIARVSDADVFIFMGANFEAFMEAASWRRATRQSPVPTIEYAEHLELTAVDRVIDHGDHTHDLTGGDPHIWLDPLGGIDLVRVTIEQLSALDPGGAEVYRANGDAYIAEIEALHADYEAVVARIPEERRKLVVFHDAYGYFEDRYGFEVIGVVLRSAGGEPSAADVADLHRTVTETGVTVVFREPQYQADVLEQLARDRGIEVGLLMTDTFADGVDSYLGLMRFNLRSLEQHLAS